MQNKGEKPQRLSWAGQRGASWTGLEKGRGFSSRRAGCERLSEEAWLGNWGNEAEITKIKSLATQALRNKQSLHTDARVLSGLPARVCEKARMSVRVLRGTCEATLRSHTVPGPVFPAQDRAASHRHLALSRSELQLYSRLLIQLLFLVAFPLFKFLCPVPATEFCCCCCLIIYQFEEAFPTYETRGVTRPASRGCCNKELVDAKRQGQGCTERTHCASGCHYIIVVVVISLRIAITSFLARSPLLSSRLEASPQITDPHLCFTLCGLHRVNINR